MVLFYILLVGLLFLLKILQINKGYYFIKKYMNKSGLIIFLSVCFAVTANDIYDNSWALIIGIDKYQNVQKLNYAVADAESIKEILIHTFNFPEANISLITDENATKQNIIKSFSSITKNAKTNDRVVVFFAGHGETMDLPGGGEKGYLIPVEGDANDLYVTSIPMDELKQIALMSEAKHMLYLVDACYGGIAAVGSRGLLKEEAPNYLKKVTKFPSRQVITAGGRGEKVIEKPEWGHSAFTLNIKRGLKDGAADINSDGYITANELGMFLSERVSVDSENQQTPQYGRMTSQEGEFVFVYSDNINITPKVSNNSRDKQLDLILEELKQLKSQQNSNEISSKSISKELNTGISKTGQIYQYWKMDKGLGIITTPSITTLEFYKIVNEYLSYSIEWAHSRNKISTDLISNTHSNEMHQMLLTIDYGWIFDNRYRAFIGTKLGFASVNFKDSLLDLEDSFNYIKTSAIAGFGIKLFKLVKPIPTELGFKTVFELTDQVNYKVDQLGNMQIENEFIIEPKILFLFSLPR